MPTTPDPFIAAALAATALAGHLYATWQRRYAHNKPARWQRAIKASAGSAAGYLLAGAVIALDAPILAIVLFAASAVTFRYGQHTERHYLSLVDDGLRATPATVTVPQPEPAPRPGRYARMRHNQVGSDRGRYVATSISGPLIRGEFRSLPSGRIRACCLQCGRVAEGNALNPFPEHDCIPTPDPDLTD